MLCLLLEYPAELVSPRSIRLRILKVNWGLAEWQRQYGFTTLDPLEDTERCRLSLTDDFPSMFHHARSA